MSLNANYAEALRNDLEKKKPEHGNNGGIINNVRSGVLPLGGV